MNTIILPPEYAEKLRLRDEARAAWQAERARWMQRQAQYKTELVQAKAAWRRSGGDWRAWLRTKRNIKDDQRHRECVAIGEEALRRQGRTVETRQDRLDAIRLGAHEQARRLAGRPRRRGAYARGGRGRG